MVFRSGDIKDLIEFSKGAYDRKSVMCIQEDTMSASNFLKNEGWLEVPAVVIDEDITEPLTFIKMDVEGGEQRALAGCAKHIRNDRPFLDISLYHNNEDVWKIPRVIDDICPGYRFYLRYTGGMLHPTELSLLAVYPD